MKPLAEELGEYLADGVLTEEFVLNNIDGLLDALREANVSARWLLLHGSAVNPALRAVFSRRAPGPEAVIDLLLDAAELEMHMKVTASLLDGKEGRSPAVQVGGGEPSGGARGVFRRRGAVAQRQG